MDMDMFLKLVFLSIISCTHAEPLLRRLYDMKGGFEVTVCSVEGDRCEGALFLADWVVVIDSCLSDQDIKQIYVQKGIVPCTQETTTPSIEPKGESSMRGIADRFSHPLAPDVDLALLKLDCPYAGVSDNNTLSFNALNFLDMWMEGIVYSSTENAVRDVSNRYMQYRMYSSSIKMIFVTVILPSVSFIICFLFIVFYTGTTNTSKISYKKLNDKKSSHV